MIKLNRGEAPKELTDEVRKELTKLYNENKDKDVWNSPKVKQPLKDALLQMSHKKCAYCECKLEIESKDVTIDHFLPKSTNSDKVVEWENLLPSCLRCNRKKNDNEENLIDPCVNEPKDFLALDKKNPYRFKGIDSKQIGKNTILAIGLNDIERLMVPRMSEWEDIHQRLEDLFDNLQEQGIKGKYKKQLETLMEKCTKESSYAAVKATNMLNDDTYFLIKNFFEVNNAWTSKYETIELEMKEVAMRLV